MKKLTSKEMKNIKGGSASAIAIGLGISILVSFVIGVISGFTNPIECGGEE